MFTNENQTLNTPEVKHKTVPASPEWMPLPSMNAVSHHGQHKNILHQKYFCCKVLPVSHFILIDSNYESEVVG